ncbi:conserved hypothetical protein [Planktothrix paucivesiculata PCC 9631]|uniref:Segregation and condensation protein A n=1 Tax=Planktothrix paucivesiculata PCC 9631 TaxID=671071 RepID=A0A7Z9BY60_9CYAN|nr:conserved hypothetical protein [Planktothrix paucivesiculata PCC 9631]
MISGDSAIYSPNPIEPIPPPLATPQDALTALSEGIALLIDLAQRGEIDPWDVQVIDVIDRYLSKLTPPEESSSSNNFAELSQSGQAFLYASMLVLLKADSLMATETLDPNAGTMEGEEFLDPEDEGNGIQRPQQLEKQIRRRAVAKIPQKRQVTLQELIEQLQLMAATIAAQKARPRPRANTAKSRATTAKAIAELAHQENLVEMAAQVEQLLNSGSQQTPAWFDLEQLLSLWLEMKQSEQPSPPEENPIQHSPNHDRVGVFWALLLLSAQSKVELAQEEFYQELKVRSLTEPPAKP